MKKSIVIITDCVDAAYNELRGTLTSLVKKDVVIEPVVPVAPFSIINGAFLLRLMAEAYPAGTIFFIILNPLRKRPARVIGRTKIKKLTFITANTGVLDWLVRDFGLDVVHELPDPGFLPFGGKYVHAPAVAQIANGVDLRAIGKSFDPSHLPKLKLAEGTVVHIDCFGLMKFTGSLPSCNEGEIFLVSVNGKKPFRATYAKRMMSRATGEWVLYPGSSLGLPELGKVRENGAQKLGVAIGDVISFRKK